MAFNAEQTTDLIVDHSDNDYVYFKVPANLRVRKVDGVIEGFNLRVKEHRWIPVTLTESRCSKSSFTMRFFKNDRSYGAARVIATALIPNPNPEKFKFVICKDNNPANLDPSNLEWGTRFEMRAKMPSTIQWTAEELKELEKIPYPHNEKNLEYQRFLNKKRDANGLTKAERFKLKKDLEEAMTDKEITEACYKEFLLSKPVFDPITHLEKGYRLPTREELKEMLSKSSSSQAVKFRAEVLWYGLMLEVGRKAALAAKPMFANSFNLVDSKKE